MQKTLMNKMVRKRLYRNFIDMIQKMKTVELIVFDKFVTTTQMAILKDKSCQTIATRIKELQEIGIVKRNGPDKGDFWEILQ